MKFYNGKLKIGDRVIGLNNTDDETAYSGRIIHVNNREGDAFVLRDVKQLGCGTIYKGESTWQIDRREDSKEKYWSDGDNYIVIEHINWKEKMERSEKRQTEVIK